MIKHSRDGSGKPPKKFQLVVSGEMYSQLEVEQKKRMTLNVQAVINQILSEYFSRLLTHKQEAQ